MTCHGRNQHEVPIGGPMRRGGFPQGHGQDKKLSIRQIVRELGLFKKAKKSDLRY